MLTSNFKSIEEDKRQIKDKLLEHLYYILLGSPFKDYHYSRYNELIKQFNRLLAKEK